MHPGVRKQALQISTVCGTQNKFALTSLAQPLIVAFQVKKSYRKVTKKHSSLFCPFNGIKRAFVIAKASLCNPPQWNIRALYEYSAQEAAS